MTDLLSDMGDRGLDSGVGAVNPRVEQRRLRKCLASFPTGVTILTYELGGQARGATVSSFVSVSLAPPLVLASISRSARAYENLRTCPFTVNILATEQRELALHFAGRGKGERQLPFEAGVVCPRITGCLAYVSCNPWDVYEAGDHALVVGEVCDIESRHETTEDAAPLLFYRSNFWTVGSPMDLTT